MENIQGVEINKFPLDLNHVMDLIYFEGPLLSLFKNESGDHYLYYWCDVDDIYNRWIIFRISQQNLKNYLLKKTALSDLIVKPVDGFVYVVDINDELRFNNVCLIKSDELPQSYIPESDSFYDMETELDELNKKEKLFLLNFLIDKNTINYSLEYILKYQYVIEEIKKQLKTENFSDSDLPLSISKYPADDYDNYDNEISFNQLFYKS